MLCRFRNCVFRLPRHDLKITSTDGEEVTPRTWRGFRLPFFGAECWVWSRGTAKWFYRFSRQPHRNLPKGPPKTSLGLPPRKWNEATRWVLNETCLKWGCAAGGIIYLHFNILSLMYYFEASLLRVMHWQTEGFFLNPAKTLQETWNHLRHYDFPLELCWFSWFWFCRIIGNIPRSTRILLLLLDSHLQLLLR